VATTVYINGKFAAQTTTGVQRVARCLVDALDRGLVDSSGPPPISRWILLCPPGGRVPTLRHIEVRVVGSGRGGLHVWEQWVLPRAARDGLLVNLAGSAPAWAGRQVCTLHDAAVFDRPEAYSLVFRTWYRWLFRRLARTAVAIHTGSNFSRERLALWLGLEAGRIAINPNGGDHLRDAVADSAVLVSAGLVGRRFVLAVGSASASKNIAALIAAFAQLQDADLRLVIAGGNHPAVFAAAGAAAPQVAESRVVRLGSVGDGELKALYSAAAVLAFASLYEGFGLPPLEAMSCGCPVVGASTSAVPEVCGDAALYVDPASPDDIARGLAQVLGDATLAADLVRRGQARLANFTWDSSAARLRSLLQPLAAQPAAGRG
jgi:glycosyltransferase involved in cell wall biosynthesis